MATQPIANPITNQPDLNTARQFYTQAAGSAMPSKESMDNAAARVRARLAAQGAGQRRDIQREMAGRGVSNSGIQRSANLTQSANEQMALGGALSDLQSNWWDKQQEGANILGNIGSRFADMGQSLTEAEQVNQRLANDWALGYGGLEEEKRKNLMDSLLGTGSLYGQFGNLQITNPELRAHWEQLMKTLATQQGQLEIPAAPADPNSPPAPYKTWVEYLEAKSAPLPIGYKTWDEYLRRYRGEPPSGYDSWIRYVEGW